MKNNNITAVLSVFLFLAVFSFTVYAAEDGFGIGMDVNIGFMDNTPQWSNNTTSVTSGSQYSPGQNYQFNVTWTDAINQVNLVLIEHNFTGNTIPHNDTVITNESDVYYFNVSDLAVGTYVWKFYANDETDDSNVTNNGEYWIYEVAQNSTNVTLKLNGEEGNKTYFLNQTVNFSSYLLLPNKTVYLDSNYTGWTILSNNTSFVTDSINLTSIGTFYITSYWDDSDENYTNGSKTYFFNIANIIWSDNQTSVASGSNYTQGRNYGFQIDITGNVSQVIFEADFINGTQNYTVDNSTTYNNITINQSGDIYWINFTDLGGGSYDYRWIAVDNNSIEISTDSLTFLINRIVVVVSLGLDTYTTTPSSNVVATCSVSPAHNLTLYITGSGISTCSGNNSVSCSFVVPSSTGTFTYNCNSVGNRNYSIGYDSKNLVVATFDGGDTLGGADTSSDTTSVQGQFTLSASESTITMDAGSSKVISFSLINTYENDINVTSITVSGIDSGWYALDKTMISRLKDGTTEKVKMTLNIPANATADTYSIKVKALGKNLFSGASLTRETIVTLTVSSNNTAEEVVVAAVTSEDAELEVLSDNGNETSGWALPTGLLSMSSEYFPYMILVLGIALSLIVFMKRGMLTQNLMKMGGAKSGKKSKSGLSGIKKMFSANLPKINKAKPKTLELKEEKVKDLETEITKDIKELKNIMESEKKIKKNRK
ncbi:MAG: hypothetical protein V1818_02165 [Candidatus Aenigmatarchaeota archaeon]